MSEGADYFAHFPTIPAAGMIANINVDITPGVLYPGKDIPAIGSEHSSLLKNAESAAHQSGCILSPDIFPQRNYFGACDQYSFVLQGVPAVWVHRGPDRNNMTSK